MRPAEAARALLAAALVALSAACATVPPVQQAFALGHDGVVVGRSVPCTGSPAAPTGERIAEPLPGPTLRVASWNLHKNGTPGWDTDLARIAAGSDLLLLQEAAMSEALLQVLAAAGYDWTLAGSFALNGRETGVLSAARVRPTSACVQRAFEPLLRLPKAAAITRYRMRGTDETLAVANLHAINFALGLGDYRAQLQAIAQELAGHRGPVIVAGDLNTWSPVRLDVVDEVMHGMGLAPVLPPVDTRSRFLRQQVDYLYVRGFDVLHAEAPEVESSDHNPLVATLRLHGAAR